MITWIQSGDDDHIHHFYVGDLRVSIIAQEAFDDDRPTKWDKTDMFVGCYEDDPFLVVNLKAKTLKKAKEAAVKELRKWLQINLHALGPDLEVS